MDEWYADVRNLHDLAEWLVRHHGYDVENVLELLDKPYHWTAEWEQFRSFCEGERAAAEDEALRRVEAEVLRQEDVRRRLGDV
jgi:hypothetical protein